MNGFSPNASSPNAAPLENNIVSSGGINAISIGAQSANTGSATGTVTPLTLTAPVYVGAGVQISGSSVTSLTAFTPAGSVAGQFLLAFVTINDFLSNTVATPSGWTLLRRDTDLGGSAVDTTWVYWRFVPVGGLASATFTFASTSASAIILSYNGVDATVPINAHSVKSASTVFNVNDTIAPRVDVPTADTLYVALFALITANHNRLTTFSGDVTSRFSSGTTPPSSIGFYAADKTLSATGIPVLPTAFATDGASASIGAFGVLYSIALRAAGSSGSSIMFGQSIQISDEDAFIDTTAATLALTSNGFYPHFGGDARNITVGRWQLPGAGIPAGATIEKASAYLIARTSVTIFNPPAKSDIAVERSATPSAYSSYADYVARAWTSSAVQWTLANTVLDSGFSSPDFASLLQAVKTEFSGSPLTNVAVRFSTVAGTSTSNIQGWTYNTAANKSAMLEVTYNSGSSGGGAINAASTGTQGANTGVSSGAVLVTGASTGTQGANTGGSSATVLVSAASSAVQAGNSGSSAGSIAVQGASSGVQSANTGATSGAVTVGAISSGTQPGNSGAGTAGVAVTVVSSGAQGANTGNASGTVGFTGINATSSGVQGANTGVSSVAVRVTATSSGTQGANTGVSAGGVTIASSSAGVQGASTGVSSGTLAVQANSSGVQGANSGVSSGTVGFTGVNASSSGAQGANTGVSSGTVAVTAVSSGVQGAVTGASAGTLTVSATSSGVQSSNTGVSSGAVRVTATSSGVQPANTGSSSGSVANPGINATSSGTQAANTGASSASVAVQANSSGTQPANTGSSAGQVTQTITSSGVQAPNTGTASGTVRVQGNSSGTQTANTGVSSVAVRITATSSGAQGAVTGSATGGITALPPIICNSNGMQQPNFTLRFGQRPVNPSGDPRIINPSGNDRHVQPALETDSGDRRIKP